jgi:peroxin-14
MQYSYPNRDWRDWFIMATVTGSVGYGLYYLSKRYIYPLIAPPTPPQLEADKLSIDAKFTQAFDILDTLKTDTAALKLAEEDRKARVDAALEEVESVVQDLKNAGKRREDESKRVGDEVRGLRDLIPKALEGQKEQQKKALEDLQNELKSLKQLVMNRTAPARPAYTPSGIVGTPPLDPGAASSAASAPTPAPQPMNSGMNGGMNGGMGGMGGGMGGMGTMGTQGPAGGLASIMGGMKDNSAPSPAAAPRGYGTGKPSIPAWQMAASRANAAPAAPAPAAAGSSKEGDASS